MLSLKQLLPTLSDRGVDRVEITYDGSGDSGNVQDVLYYDLDEEFSGEGAKLLEEFTPIFIRLGEQLLEQWHPGYGNEEGGYGTITVRIPTAEVLIEHNDRYVEVSTTENAFDVDDVKFDTLDE